MSFLKRFASGVGQGLIENSQMAMRKEQELELARGKSEIAMSQERDMTKYRNDLIEAARARRAQTIGAGVESDMAALGDKATPEMRDRAMARQAAIYDGKEDKLYDMQKSDKDFGLREKAHEESIALRKDSSARGWASENRAQETQERNRLREDEKEAAFSRWRRLRTDGNLAEADELAEQWGFGTKAKVAAERAPETREAFVSKTLAAIQKDNMGRPMTQQAREAAIREAEATYARIYGGPGAQNPGTQKPGERPPLSQFR